MKNEFANYAVSISDGASWVTIEVYGSVSADQGGIIIREAIELANRHDLRDFFYDGSDSINTISILGQYQLVHQDLAEHQLDRRSKIAMLISPQDSSHDFIETVLRNADYNCRLFTDRAEATNWLQASETKSAWMVHAAKDDSNPGSCSC